MTTSAGTSNAPPATPFVFGTSSSGGNDSTSTTTAAVESAPSTAAPTFAFGATNTTNSTTASNVRDSTTAPSNGSSVPNFSLAGAGSTSNNAPSSQATTDVAAKPTFAPFQFGNSAPGNNTAALTASSAISFGMAPPVAPTLVPTATSTSSVQVNGTTSANASTATTEPSRPFVFGATANNTNTSSVSNSVGAGTFTPFDFNQNAVPQSNQVGTFVFGSSNNTTAPSMPIVISQDAGPPSNGTTAPIPAAPLFGSTTVAPTVAPLLSNTAAPSSFGSNNSSHVNPAPTGPFSFGASNNNIVSSQSSGNTTIPTTGPFPSSAPFSVPATNPFSAAPFGQSGGAGRGGSNVSFGSAQTNDPMSSNQSGGFSQPPAFGQNAAALQPSSTFGNPTVSNPTTGLMNTGFAQTSFNTNGGFNSNIVNNGTTTPVFGANVNAMMPQPPAFQIGTASTSTPGKRRIVRARRP